MTVAQFVETRAEAEEFNHRQAMLMGFVLIAFSSSIVGFIVGWTTCWFLHH